MTNGNSIFRTRIAKIWLEEGKILRTVIYPNSEITSEDAKEVFNAHLELAEDKQVASLVDIRGIKSATREARSFPTTASVAKFPIALALLVDSPVSRVIANFFLGVNKPSYPTKFFNSENEAITWLKGIIK